MALHLLAQKEERRPRGEKGTVGRRETLDVAAGNEVEVYTKERGEKRRNVEADRKKILRKRREKYKWIGRRK